jgi:DNA replication and repair protein RecF
MHSPFLRISRLTLTDFRNYRDLRLEAEAGTLVFTGPNGAGKTNLLEAVSLLTPGRGLRGASYDECARKAGPGSWAVAATVESENGVAKLGTAWDGSAADSDGLGGARIVIVDGVRQKSSGALADHLRCLWVTPAMDRLFSGPASDRRRFLDRLTQTFDPAHGTRVTAFEKLMRDRHIVLAGASPDPAWISGLETQMAEAAVAVAAARLAAIEALRGHIASTRGASAFPFAEIAIEGEIEALLGTMPAVKAEDEYRRILADSRNSDSAAGRTLRGPHRSDFLVVHEPTGMPAAQCSTGEQKALLIGLILAHAGAVREAWGAAPVLLLDEVAAHLDGLRREGLYAALARLGAQVWMTGTDAVLFGAAGEGSEFFHVEAGTVTVSARN